MNGQADDSGDVLLVHERALWQTGYRLVAGVDEVGRGALAGPLVASAVILPILSELPGTDVTDLAGIRDSKVLSPAQREAAYEVICGLAVTIGIGVVPPTLVDRIGIVAANRRAMEDAILQLAVAPDAVLLDAVVTDLGHPQIGLIDGDARSLSVAAASIIAKVTRDRYMVEQDQLHPPYGFAAHKGYGVARHLAALAQHGPCALHRRSFAPVRLCLPAVDAAT
jgi:ribonuclease HII